MSVYPKWIYHRTEAPKIVETKEEHEQAGKGWEETPAAFDKESDETSEKSATGKEKNPDITQKDFTKMTVAQLTEALIQNGVAEEKLKGLKKDQLIAMLGNI